MREGRAVNRYFYLSPSPDGWRNLGLDEYFLDHLGEDDILLYLYLSLIHISRSASAWAASA